MITSQCFQIKGNHPTLQYCILHIKHILHIFDEVVQSQICISQKKMKTIAKIHQTDGVIGKMTDKKQKSKGNTRPPSTHLEEKEESGLPCSISLYVMGFFYLEKEKEKVTWAIKITLHN